MAELSLVVWVLMVWEEVEVVPVQVPKMKSGLQFLKNKK